ncbi:hypothetical protein ACFFKC_16400 [Pseudoduganella danionis]|uniref:STAS domain-containing protein n=1 Tax=Pseudoduganella danionis TaxID=1890295 RepID=A0ABW9SN60_9BURK|nr:hypothetical protein [Pseudoduganella danionis]MTW33472.1 hypothetical protein [Pseudoduganella danionis]
MSAPHVSAVTLGCIETDHAGVRLIVHASAEDHCNMRASQLASLLRLISADGLDAFLGQDRATKDGVLWLASSLADEVERMLPVVSLEISLRGTPPNSRPGPEVQDATQ